MKLIHKILIGGLALVVVAALVLGAVANWSAYREMIRRNASLKALRDQMSTLQTDVSGMQGSLSGLQEHAGAVQSDVSELREEFRARQDAEEDAGQEDDVVIAGSYTIRSTTPISDAYLSGDRSALDDRQKETLDMAAAVLDKIIKDGMTDYEKEKAVYDWMTHNLTNDGGLLTVIPQTQEDCDNPYGVLKYHNAICVGYATTFRLFMQMLEIPCKVCHNTERYHSWDLVQLDGGWYHTDIYSDAGSGNYSHFNMTDLMWGREQSWNRSFFPAADAYDYCYACMGAVDETDIYHVPAALRAALEERAGLCALRFDSSLTEVDAQIVQNMLYDIDNRLNNSSAFDMYMDWNWVPVDQGFVLAINLNWSDNGEDPVDPVEIPDEAYEKMGEAVEDAFGDVEVDYWEDTNEDFWSDDETDWHHSGPVG